MAEQIDPIPAPIAAQGATHIESVLGDAEALGAAAIASHVETEQTPPAYDPALEMDTAFDNYDLDKDQITIPPAHIAYEMGDKKRSGRRAALAIMAVAFLGGTAVLGSKYIGGEEAAAPIILASTEPVKVKPKEAGGKIVPNQNLAVYKSVDGGADETPKQERLTDKSEKPIAVATKSVSNKSETRVATTTDNKTTTDNETTGGLVVQPRRVRTVVVRPDGTLVSVSKSQPVENGAKVQVASPTLALQPSVGTLNASDLILPTATKTPKADLNAPAKLQAKAPETKSPVTLKPVVVAKVQLPKPVKVKSVAKIEPPKPVKLKPVSKVVPKKEVAKTPANATVPSVSSPYAVQISSQRSAAAAKKSYDTLSRRYAGVLKGKGVDIREAIVKGKGSYFRVRIPAQTRSAANKMCQQLKSKGGDCFVTR